MNRIELSEKYAIGYGLEIGALCFPWPLPKNSVVYNLDYHDEKTLEKMFPEHSGKNFIKVDFIDDANFCKSITDNRYDFLVSSHNIEHMEDPISAIENWLRVVKVGGHVIMAIPLKDKCFDRERESTSIEHIIEDYLDNEILVKRKAQTYREYLSKVDKLSGEVLERAVSHCVENNTNIHFHCWTMKELNELFLCLEGTDSLSCVLLKEEGHEAFVVLKKLREPEFRKYFDYDLDQNFS